MEAEGRKRDSNGWEKHGPDTEREGEARTWFEEIISLLEELDCPYNVAVCFNATRAMSCKLKVGSELKKLLHFRLTRRAVAHPNGALCAASTTQN